MKSNSVQLCFAANIWNAPICVKHLKLATLYMAWTLICVQIPLMERKQWKNNRAFRSLDRDWMTYDEFYEIGPFYSEY